MSWPGPSFTPVQIPPIPERIQYSDKILMMGSCFTEHIGEHLLSYKYDVLQNPFGILYNPVSIAESVSRIAEKKYYAADELVYHDSLYHSMDHHGSYSGIDVELVLQKLNAGIDTAHQHMGSCKHVVISPGTIRAYRYKLTGKIAGNNHKIPQSQFDKIKLSPKEAFQAFERVYHVIKGMSPSAKFIWTVSPVRHLRDGLIENQRSKASLILAAEWITEQSPDCYYFPAYEIMLDQLRDYRYYANDMVHPSATAIGIIWDLFCENYLDPNESKVHLLIEKIKQGMQHRFLHDKKEAIADFGKTQLDLIQRIKALSPHLNFDQETDCFTALITS